MVKLHPSKSSYYYGLVQEFIKYLIWKVSLRVFQGPQIIGINLQEKDTRKTFLFNLVQQIFLRISLGTEV